MDERVSRVRIEARITPRAKAGSKRALSDPQASTAQPGKPPAANQPGEIEGSASARLFVELQAVGFADPAAGPNVDAGLPAGP